MCVDRTTVIGLTATGLAATLSDLADLIGFLFPHPPHAIFHQSGYTISLAYWHKNNPVGLILAAKSFHLQIIAGSSCNSVVILFFFENVIDPVCFDSLYTPK